MVERKNHYQFKRTNLMNLPEITIRVPGTSANLGPGFDIMGLALKIYNDFHFDFIEPNQYKITLMDEAPVPFPPEDNLMVFAYKEYMRNYLPNLEYPGLSVKMELNLPLKGGLGSSASALIAGYFLGRYVHGYISNSEIPDDQKMLYDLAVIEGHPDNTTPAYLGGFIFSYFYGENLRIFRETFPDSINMYLFIPKLETETNESRKKLPENYPTNDLIFNMSRIGTWYKFLQTHDFDHLRLATEDKIHTPYRITENSLLAKITNFILDFSGAYSLSGSGPTLLLYFPREFNSENYERLNNEINKICLEYKVDYILKKIEVCNLGTRFLKNPSL
jgi:homoserine kinase